MNPNHDHEKQDHGQQDQDGTVTPFAAGFEALRDQEQLSLGREFLLFLRDNKKWWLLPILIVLLLVTTLVTLTSTGAAPFIYSLF